MINHPELTDEQRRGLEIDRAMGLLAGAGSGKTRVLTERFLELLEKARMSGKTPEDALSSIVAITFTRKAAAEMTTRIAERCEELAGKCGDPSEFWHEIALRMADAKISTIHSFCAGIIREHPTAAGFDIAFDENAPSPVPVRAAALRFCRSIAQENQELRPIAEKLSELLGWERLPRALEKAFNKRGLATEMLLNNPSNPEELLEKWRKISRDIGSMWSIEKRKAFIQRLEELRQLSANVDPSDGLASNINSILEKLPKSERLESFVNITEDLVKKDGGARSFGGKGNKNNWPAGATLQTARAAMTELATEFAEIAPFLPTEFTEFDRNDAETLCLFARLYERFIRDETEILFPPDSLDFSDMILGARRVISDKGVAQDIASSVDGFLVDEFQDTDPLQWEIISQIAERASGQLFWVGDPKQSIYGFRGADVSNVKRAQEWLDSREGDVWPLGDNFRSTQNIVKFVNSLGDRIFSPDSPMDFDFLAKPQRLSKRRKLPSSFDGSVEILLALAEDDAEAELITRRVWAAVNGDNNGEGRLQVEDDGKIRGAQWGDIAILYPTRKILDNLKRALLTRNIPHLEIGGQGFYSTDEVLYAINLLFYLADRRDALSLVGLLRGPLFALPDTVIIAASIAGEKDIRKGIASLGSPNAVTIREILTKEELSLAEKCGKILEELEDLATVLPPSELLSRALEMCGAWATFRGMLNGEQRIANLEKFIGVCTDYDSRGLRPLTTFLRAVLDDDEREREAAVEYEGTNTVKLMTIHQAKGLEFPIAVVANLSDNKNRGSNEVFRWHRLTGPHLCARAANGEEKGQFYNLIKAIEKSEDDAEARRQLYVAATRARDHLIFSASEPNKGYMTLLTEATDIGERTPGIHLLEVNTEEGTVEITLSVGLDSWQIDPPEKPPGEPVFVAINDGLRVDGEAPLDSAPIKEAEGLWHIRATDLPELVTENQHGRFDSAQRLDFRSPSEVEESEGRGTEWGTVVHRFLETLPCPIPEDDELETIAQKAVSSQNTGITSPTEAIRELVALTHDHTIKSFFSVGAEVDRREERVVLREGELIITGVIDRLWKDRDGWHIVDYKSDAVVDAERQKKLEYYTIQLATYRRAVGVALDIPEDEISTAILFTHNPTEIIPIPDIELDALLEKAKAALRRKPLNIVGV